MFSGVCSVIVKWSIQLPHWGTVCRVQMSCRASCISLRYLKECDNSVEMLELTGRRTYLLYAFTSELVRLLNKLVWWFSDVPKETFYILASKAGDKWTGVSTVTLFSYRWSATMECNVSFRVQSNRRSSLLRFLEKAPQRWDTLGRGFTCSGKKLFFSVFSRS